MTNQFRKEILKLTKNEFLIEIVDNAVLIGNKKTVNNDDVVSLATLGYNLGELKH